MNSFLRFKRGQLRVYVEHNSVYCESKTQPADLMYENNPFTVLSQCEVEVLMIVEHFV